MRLPSAFGRLSAPERETVHHHRVYNFNDADYLPEAVDSVLAQTRAPERSSSSTTALLITPPTCWEATRENVEVHVRPVGAGDCSELGPDGHGDPVPRTQTTCLSRPPWKRC
jgi:hypothetical protein